MLKKTVVRPVSAPRLRPPRRVRDEDDEEEIEVGVDQFMRGDQGRKIGSRRNDHHDPADTDSRRFPWKQEDS